MHARYGEAGEFRSAAWMEQVGLVVEPITLAQSKIAVSAFAKFQGRPARLNLGDCFAYVLASVKGVPLLYKGGDFGHTGISAA